jgi:hypothetical protein
VMVRLAYKNRPGRSVAQLGRVPVLGKVLHF